MTTRVLVRRAEVRGALCDVVWCDGVVESVAPTGTWHVNDAPWDELDAAGGALLPGLHDHHTHVVALAAARSSVLVGPPDVRTVQELRSVLTAACIAASTSNSPVVRCVGYHDSVAGSLDADALDRIMPPELTVPLRVQHRSGQLWVLNSLALAVGRIDELDAPGVERDASGRPTGRVYGHDELLRGRFTAPTPDLAATCRELASYGVTGLTDASPWERADDLELLEQAVGAAGLPVRVMITGGPQLPSDAAGSLPRGPVKILPPDHRDPDLDQLIDSMQGAHALGRTVAVHCVTRVGLIVALAAWREVGVIDGDRIEHGAMVPAELIDHVRELGLIVITQPNFIGERGDEYLAEVDRVEIDDLWRLSSLLAAGVRLAGGTDAPFGHPDPWRAIRSAVARTTMTGQLVGATERINAAAALQLFLGDALAPSTPRRIASGAITDLCLLREPLAEALRHPSSDLVALTIGRAGLQMADGPRQSPGPSRR